ncbi:MAG: hypothetical protein M3Q71_00160 [Chloroflexota bacterium]|nr:hypothetical protein [Chloroflexota bacterium]
MQTFKNISNSLFQDGELVVKPGESFATDNPGRITQMTGLYAWQFEETGGEAPTEDEVRASSAAQDVREVRAAGHVQVDGTGRQPEKADNQG